MAARANEELIRLLREQLVQQQQQMELQRQQTEALMSMVMATSQTPVANTNFCEFDPNTEIWSDYWSRYETFVKANSIPAKKMAEIFLTNQSSTIFKLLSNLASQSDPPRDVNALSIDEIRNHMIDQFNPKMFVVRERYKFWTRTERKPGETVHELAARIRQEAATCDFASIKDPLDEAMRTRFVCSINDEASIKALFKVKDDELSFNKAIKIAAEVEEATKVAKETLGTSQAEIFKLRPTQRPARHQSSCVPKPSQQKPPEQKRTKQTKSNGGAKQKFRCYRCLGNHSSDTCRFKDVLCHHCGIKGHIKSACRKKAQQIKTVTRVHWNAACPLRKTCFLDGVPVTFEVDTGSRDSIISQKTWEKLQKPVLSPPRCKYRCASNADLPVKGVASLMTSTTLGPNTALKLNFVVTTLNLNLLGRIAIRELGLSVDALINPDKVNKVTNYDAKPDTPLPNSYSPSELLNGRQIRAKIDVILPQRQRLDISTSNVKSHKFRVDSPCYALSFQKGRRDKWLPGVVTRLIGNMMVDVKVNGSIWRRHIDQLRVRHSNS